VATSANSVTDSLQLIIFSQQLIIFSQQLLIDSISNAGQLPSPEIIIDDIVPVQQRLNNGETLHDDFKKTIIQDNTIYLSFKNELGIYSGLKNDDEVFLREIFNKTQDVFHDINENYQEVGSPDEVLSSKINEIYQLTQIAKKAKLLGPFDKETQDALIEELEPLIGNDEIKRKELFDTSKINSDLLERYLGILARVFKNTDEVKDVKLINDVFNFLLETYISFGFYLIDEVESSNQKLLDSNTITDREIDILKILSSVIPIITQVLMYDGMGHFNIEKMIKAKINELKADAQNNQYMLFLLHLLLVDIDIDKYDYLLDDLLTVINKGVLKTSLVFKLNYYLAFKAYNKPD